MKIIFKEAGVNIAAYTIHYPGCRAHGALRTLINQVGEAKLCEDLKLNGSIRECFGYGLLYNQSTYSSNFPDKKTIITEIISGGLIFGDDMSEFQKPSLKLIGDHTIIDSGRQIEVKICRDQCFVLASKEKVQLAPMSNVKKEGYLTINQVNSLEYLSFTCLNMATVFSTLNDVRTFIEDNQGHFRELLKEQGLQVALCQAELKPTAYFRRYLSDKQKNQLQDINLLLLNLSKDM